jgi:hypothetical protein
MGFRLGWVCVPSLCSKFAFQGRVPSLCSKFAFQVCVPSLRSKVAFQVCVPSLCSKVAFQGRVPRSRSKFLIQVCVPSLYFKKVKLDTSKMRRAINKKSLLISRFVTHFCLFKRGNEYPMNPLFSVNYHFRQTTEKANKSSKQRLPLGMTRCHRNINPHPYLVLSLISAFFQ